MVKVEVKHSVWHEPTFSFQNQQHLVILQVKTLKSQILIHVTQAVNVWMVQVEAMKKAMILRTMKGKKEKNTCNSRQTAD